MTEDSIQLLSHLRRRAIDAPDSLAVREIAGGRTLDYSALRRDSMDFASALRGACPAGGVVMLRCPSSANFHVAFFGTLHAGMTIFPVPADVAPLEFDALAGKASASAVIEPDLRIAPLPTARRPAWDEPSLLLQSSGTTGMPKIVRRTAASLDACASNMVKALAVTSSDRILACVPLCHSYGIEHGLLAPIFAGAQVHLCPGFDLAVVRRELSESRVTAFPAVPSIYEMLGNLPEPSPRLDDLRLAYSAGGPLPESVFEKVQAAFGVEVAQLYGATELGSITFTPPTDPAFDRASVGRAMRGVEFRVDSDGQLLAKAPSMLDEYVGDPSGLSPDGFFPTGDLAHLDAAGNLFIDGRLKFLIDVGGLKVNPTEVEREIAGHPSVAACVVVPMRLSETVWRLKAIITPTDARHPPAADELRRYARERLTPHKIPRVFELRDSLPRSATGKVLRHLLVESA